MSRKKEHNYDFNSLKRTSNSRRRVHKIIFIFVNSLIQGGPRIFPTEGEVGGGA